MTTHTLTEAGTLIADEEPLPRGGPQSPAEHAGNMLQQEMTLGVPRTLDPELDLVHHAVLRGARVAIARNGDAVWGGQPVTEPIWSFTPPPPPTGSEPELRARLDAIHRDALARTADREQRVKAVEAQFDGKQLARALAEIAEADRAQRLAAWGEAVATTQALEGAARQPRRVNGQTVAVAEHAAWLVKNALPEDMLHGLRAMLDAGDGVEEIGILLRKTHAMLPAYLKPYQGEVEELLRHPAIVGGGARARERETIRYARTTLAAIRRVLAG